MKHSLKKKKTSLFRFQVLFKKINQHLAIAQRMFDFFFQNVQQLEKPAIWYKPLIWSKFWAFKLDKSSGLSNQTVHKVKNTPSSVDFRICEDVPSIKKKKNMLAREISQRHRKGFIITSLNRTPHTKSQKFTIQQIATASGILRVVLNARTQSLFRSCFCFSSFFF